MDSSMYPLIAIVKTWGRRERCTGTKTLTCSIKEFALSGADKYHTVIELDMGAKSGGSLLSFSYHGRFKQ
jgi:hypothetical protein